MVTCTSQKKEEEEEAGGGQLVRLCTLTSALATWLNFQYLGAMFLDLNSTFQGISIPPKVQV